MARREKPFRVGQVVTPRWFITGSPVGLSTDTRCVVRELRMRRARVTREDGRGGDYWLDFDAMRAFGGAP